jgi:hypothetical protein
MQLTQKYISATAVSAPPPATVPFVKPLSYEFRVAEFLNDDGKIETVKLQMQIWEHDEYGSGTVKQFWHDVPRQKFDKNGTLILPI